ncbi:hypothetical protein J3F83DRAFT_263165 [Trichoderma novae-zelandiae]
MTMNAEAVAFPSSNLEQRQTLAREVVQLYATGLTLAFPLGGSGERHSRRNLTIHPPVRPVRAGHMESCQAPTNGGATPGPSRYAARDDGSSSHRAPSGPIAGCGTGLEAVEGVRRLEVSDAAVGGEASPEQNKQWTSTTSTLVAEWPSRPWVLDTDQEPVPPSQ